MCKEIGVPYVMAKAKNELHATVLEKIGADSVIFPALLFRPSYNPVRAQSSP